MGSPTHEIKDLDARPDRPKMTPQDEIVSSYLENRSEVFRDLVKVQSDVSDISSFWQIPLTFRVGME